MNSRLYRSPTDKVIGGVAGGLAVWLNIDPSLIRIAWVLLAIFSGGIFVLVYFVMMLVVPLPPPGWVPQQPSGGAPGAGQAGWGSAGGATWGAPGEAGAPGTGGMPGEAPPPAGGTAGWSGQSGAGQAPPASTAWSPPSVGNGNVGIVVGAALILVGAWFLLDEYVNIDWSMLWPVVVIVLGIGLIAGAMRRGRSGG